MKVLSRGGKGGNEKKWKGGRVEQRNSGKLEIKSLILQIIKSSNQ
jgi:hypothetical protein